MSIIILVFALSLFVGLVIVHEMGHFFAARRNGIEVEEFGIGFPPIAKVLGKKNGTVYTLNWLPLGGFVRLKGENDADRRTGSFGAASTWAKVKVMLAGVSVNFLVAYVLFIILALSGMPKAELSRLPFYSKEQFTVASDTKVVSNKVLIGISPKSPAEKAGLKDNDQLLSVGNRPITDADKVSSITEELAGKTVDIEYIREGEKHTVEATLNRERTESQGYLGVVPLNNQIVRATWSAPIMAAGVLGQYTELTFKGIGYALSNLWRGNTQAAQDSVGGPVATVKILSDSSSFGLSQTIFIIALISLSLAIMNSLPIPALDGGKLFVMLLFRAINKPLTKKTEEWIHGTGFALLMLLFVLITIVDVKRFF